MAAATVVDVLGLNIGLGGLGAMGTGLAGIVTFWFKIRAEGRETRREQDAARKAERAALEAELLPLRAAIGTFKSKEALAEDRAALQRDIDDVRHDLRNERARIDALDTKRQEADRWQAKMDLTIENIKDGQARIERDMKEGFGRLEKLILGRHALPGD